LQEVFATGKVKREEVFITTKLWQDEREDVEGAVRRSLAKLKLDYIDLYLIHWMCPKLVWEDGKDFIKNTPTHKVWAEMERLVDAGLIKSIGVSNANVTVILDLWSYARIKPVANQIELHPYFVQNELVAFFEKLGVKLIAYAPLSASAWPLRDKKLKDINLLEEPVIKSIAEKHGKKSAQVILNWHLKRGHVIIPKTTKVERLAENF
jgi:aldehyde reductase